MWFAYSGAASYCALLQFGSQIAVQQYRAIADNGIAGFSAVRGTTCFIAPANRCGKIRQPEVSR